MKCLRTRLPDQMSLSPHPWRPVLPCWMLVPRPMLRARSVRYWTPWARPSTLTSWARHASAASEEVLASSALVSLMLAGWRLPKIPSVFLCRFRGLWGTCLARARRVSTARRQHAVCVRVPAAPA